MSKEVCFTQDLEMIESGLNKMKEFEEWVVSKAHDSENLREIDTIVMFLIFRGGKLEEEIKELKERVEYLISKDEIV